MKKITFDIETIGTINFTNPRELELTVVGIHDSETNEYKCFTQEELPLVWPLFERANLIIGYNSEHFDIPVLNKYYTGNLSTIRHLDLLKEIKRVLGRRLRLDSIAEATLGRKKTGSGLQAVQWWKEGKYDQVKKYCLEDVKITKELYEYALKNGILKYRDFDGIRDIKLDIKSWDSPSVAAALTHTLPF